MRVLHVIPGIATRYGGPSAVIRSLCAALSRQEGMTVELATTDADGPHGRLATSEIPRDYPVHVFPRTFSDRWKYSRGLGAWLASHAADYDLIHVHALWTHSTHAAAKAARRADIPYILRPAGMLSEYSLNHRAWFKKFYWMLFESHATAFAAHFHATSAPEQADIERVVRKASVSVIPNGVDDSAWHTPPDPMYLSARTGAARQHCPVVLFMSRLHPKKGITDLLLPAWREVRSDAYLAIVGGPDEHAPECAQQVAATIERLGLRERVAFLGPVAPDQRWRLYDGAALFVLPSHSENFGVVVAEAMARGCPVVITDAVQSADHVRQANSGIVVSRSIEALREALDELLANPERRAALGQAGRAYAEAHFRWDQIAERVREMYGHCLTSRTHPPARGDNE